MKLALRMLAAAGGVAMLTAAVAAPQTIQINGAGATFPNPIYQKWFSEYNKLHPNVQINYQSVGSGAGIQQLTKQTVFFGATDGPMTNDQLAAAPGRIGYVEMIYALQTKISYGTVQNMDGEFGKASVESVTAAAAAAAAKMPPDFRVSITNAPGKGVYPISSFTWLLFYENPKDKTQAKTMVEFMKWALTDGQKYCAELGYAPLPPSVVKLEMAALGKIKIG